MVRKKKRKEKLRVKKAEFRGFIDALRDFVDYLLILRGFVDHIVEVEGEKEAVSSGQHTGRGYYSTDYEYRTKIGFSPEDFRRGYRKPRISKEKAKIIKKAASSMKIRRKEDRVSVVAHLPYEEKDIDLEIDGNRLKIAARTPKGRVERKIWAKGGKIEGARFKKGVLEVTIKRRR